MFYRLRGIMSELIEIVFEEVNESDFFSIFFEISGQYSNDVFLNNKDQAINVRSVSPQLFRDIFSLEKNHVCTLELEKYVIGRVCLQGVLIRFLKYDGNKYDIDFNFAMNKLSKIDLINLVDDLLIFCLSLSRKHKIKDFYCGLEPAKDENTRLFTGEIVGPFFLPQGPD